MQPADLVNDNVELVSLPEVCLQVQSLADEPDCTTERLGRVLSQDPALTARLLKLVNSAYYGQSSRVDTASRAISVIGFRELHHLVLAASAAEVFARIPHDLVDMVGFWKHSVFCGLVARSLAGRSRVLHDERLFIAGLLHDVGRLLIFLRLPDQAVEALTRARDSAQPICEVERSLLGFDHAQVGAELLALWKLPEALREAVAQHHDPARARVAPIEAALVHIANGITHYVEMLGADDSALRHDPYAALLDPLIPVGDVHIGGIMPAAWARTGLSERVVAPVIREAAESFDAVLNVIYPVPWPH